MVDGAIIIASIFAFLLFIAFGIISTEWMPLADHPLFIAYVVLLMALPFLSFMGLVIGLPLLPALIIGIPAVISLGIVKLFQVIAMGRAIGGIGLTLASLGVCGEVYQVLTIFYG